MPVEEEGIEVPYLNVPLIPFKLLIKRKESFEKEETDEVESLTYANLAEKASALNCGLLGSMAVAEVNRTKLSCRSPLSSFIHIQQASCLLEIAIGSNGRVYGELDRGSRGDVHASLNMLNLGLRAPLGHD